LQAKPSSWSWVFAHLNTTILDTFYISKRTRKQTQDRLHQCKQCRFQTLNSKRQGTTNIAEHLAKHGIYQTRVVGSNAQPTIVDMFKRPVSTSNAVPLMSLEQAIIEWIINTFQPFVAVEKPSFQRIFECIQHELPLRSGDTVRERIMSQVNDRYLTLKDELELVSSVSLSLDAWTSPNHIPVFAIIGHWISPNFVKKEALFEFYALKGMHSGENMARITFQMLKELGVLHKFLALTADNATNNNTLVEHLHCQLLTLFNDEVDLELGNTRTIMRFRGKEHRIRCIAHVLNLIVRKILDDLKTGTAKEAKDLNENSIGSEPLNGVVKIRMLIL